MRVQNQVGPHPTKWDKTGVVVEVKQFDQYVIKIDGSGRTSLRNRKFLRKFEPVVPTMKKFRIDDNLNYVPKAMNEQPLNEEAEQLSNKNPSSEKKQEMKISNKPPLALRRLSSTLISKNKDK